jgi:1-pyrroline-5-carboxylate dehydrogenase
MALPEFTNEPFTDFRNAENEAAYQAALATVAGYLGQTWPSHIGGAAITDRPTFDSTNPSNPAQIVGRFQKATANDADKAVTAAHATFQTWRTVSPESRAEVLFNAARLLRERKHEFSAIMTYECGKTRAEADGDTAEAIDFLEFYGREALRYGADQPLTPVAGEKNRLVYIPIGVVVVIPPWNFPLAIMAGMTTAAVVAGNTVVLKPSSDSPLVARKFIDLLEEAGMPAGVVNFLPGSGSTIGDPLVGHPLTRAIAFTGSKPVGLGVNELAAKTAEGQIWIKRVVAEMGGKDAIVVAADADLDSAAAGIVSSAFGFSGQKCSACSRLIVEESVADALVAKVVERAKTLTTDDPTAADTHMGPVINASAKRDILNYIAIGKGEGTVVLGGEALDREGHFIAPTIIDHIKPDARLAQEEIFGPVLAVIRASDFNHALEIANNTEFGLTGALYTSDEAKIERAEQEFHCGNLYFNRKCTGALVGGHPFGGFNMSGTDSKAGGRDYLLLFSQAKLLSRKV